MAVIGSFTKQPAEILRVPISYARVLGTRTADGITPTITAPSGMTQSETASVSGAVLQLWVAGGADGATYRWKVVSDIVVGGKAERVEDEFDVRVRAVADSI